MANYFSWRQLQFSAWEQFNWLNVQFFKSFHSCFSFTSSTNDSWELTESRCWFCRVVYSTMCINNLKWLALALINYLERPTAVDSFSFLLRYRFKNRKVFIIVNVTVFPIIWANIIFCFLFLWTLRSLIILRHLLILHNLSFLLHIEFIFCYFKCILLGNGV